MVILQRQNILFEMLRSYTTLAQTLNLSKAVRILGSTRQTLRRHIDILEEIRDEKLFELIDRQYYLTEAGSQSLREAEIILARGSTWLEGKNLTSSGLDSISFTSQDNFVYFLQQHHLNQLNLTKSPLLQFGLRCWVNTGSQIEEPAFAKLRPHLVIYRHHRGEWFCVEIGEKSSYASWFGWVWAKSSVGRPIDDTPDGREFSSFTAQAYQEILEGNCVRLDHVYTHISREIDKPPQPVSFQRLLLGCAFPDGEFALAILIDRTRKIELPRLEGQQTEFMQDNLIMQFDPPRQQD